jgi:small subunit ribosomal protein S10
MILKENTKIKVNFKFKSFHFYNFKNFLSKILRKIKSLNFVTSGFVSLPTKTQRFTVLRSPHVDKKSREQFEIKTHIKTLNLFLNLRNNFEKQRLKILITFIKNSAAGLNFTVKYFI